MKTNQRIVLILTGLLVIAGMSFGYALADDDEKDDDKERSRGRTYQVTITNLTRGQIISPPVVYSHRRGFNLFDLGQPSSGGLAALAEDADTEELESDLVASPKVFSVAKAAGVIPPGQSITVEINAFGPFRFISTAGMLVVTNDAFFAGQNIRVPRGYGKSSRLALAYDAGSEANSESCAYIPGPPCNNPGFRDTAGAEGYVHVHAGIHGIGDLDPELHDWRNPVALIEVQAIR